MFSVCEKICCSGGKYTLYEVRNGIESFYERTDFLCISFCLQLLHIRKTTDEINLH